MKPLLNLVTPEYVYFSNKPLPRAKPEEVKQIPIAEINTLLAKRRNLPAFTWSTDYFVPDHWQLNEEDKAIVNELKDKQIPSDKFVVCFINDEVGYGVFAREDITENSIVFYGGKLFPEPTANSHYCYQYEDGSMIDASQIGAHSALFQDLYSATVPLSDNWNFVARNNFIATSLKLSCGELTYLRVSKAIKAGSQCGQSYGNLYWNLSHINLNIVKKYFDITGNCIRETYNTDFLAINELTPEQVKAIRLNLPISKAKDGLSLSRYSTLSDEAREIVRTTAATTPEYRQAARKLAPTFFKNIDPMDMLKKYNQTSADKADVAFRRASSLGNVADMEAIYDAFSFDINGQSSNLMTALHWAYEGKHSEAIAWLLEQDKIILTIVDEWSRTPIECLNKKRPAKASGSR